MINDPLAAAAEQLEEAGVIDAKPERVRVTGQPSQIADRVGMILGKPGRLYLRGDAVCLIAESPNEPYQPEFQPVGVDFFITWVERYITWTKMGSVGGETVEKIVGVNPDLVKVLMASPQFRAHLPKVRMVNRVPLPVMRESGKVELLEPGYDAESGTYTFASDVTVERMKLGEAVDWLMGVYAECLFPLTEALIGSERVTVPCPRSMAIAMAMPVSLFVSRLLPGLAQRMGFLVTADGPGAGKTTLCKIAQAVVLGHVVMMTFGKDEEKLQTRIDTAMLGGAPTIVLDNVKRRIDSALIEMLMTSPTHEVRVFHTQRSVLVPNRTTVMITSNAAEATMDADRRFLLCALETATSDPRDLERQRDLTDGLLCSAEFRGRFLSAMWTVVAEWNDAGRPGQQAWGESAHGAGPVRTKPVAGYGDFCRVVGGVMGVISMESEGRVGDVFAPPPADLSPDTETRDMRLLLAHLTEGKGSEVEVKFGDFVRAAASLGLFAWMELPAIEPDATDEDVKRSLSDSLKARFAKFIAKKSSEQKQGGNVGKKYTLCRGSGSAADVETWRLSHTGASVRRVFRLVKA